MASMLPRCFSVLFTPKADACLNKKNIKINARATGVCNCFFPNQTNRIRPHSCQCWLLPFECLAKIRTKTVYGDELIPHSDT